MADISKLSGVDVLRKVNNLLGNTNAAVFGDMTEFSILTICISILRCGWDVTPCQLTRMETTYALHEEIGKLNASLEKRLS